MIQAKRRKKMMIYIIGTIGLLMASIALFMQQPSFGKHATGERLERIRRSPNYKDGEFKNLEPTSTVSSDKNRAEVMIDFLFSTPPNLRPTQAVDAVKIDLQNQPKDKDHFVWFGHSSFLLQVGGRKMLVDPVFCVASPIKFFNKPFSGTAIYRPEDMPEIDYLIITHDHWDHLDYETVIRLKSRVRKVICPLGVGAHFEHWGFTSERIIEMDWNDQNLLDKGFEIHCLPSRHFSGRGLKPNQTLWASFMLEAQGKTIYFSGDGGYGAHFQKIGEQFPKIDLAILENGQYNEDWANIHVMPHELGRVANDLGARQVVTGHHSKYALARHPWLEPRENEKIAAEEYSLNLLTASIGRVVAF